MTLQQVRLGKLDFPPNPKRPYGVWDGASRLAENLSRSEALAMVAGIGWGEEKRKLKDCNGPARMSSSLWKWCNVTH